LIFAVARLGAIAVHVNTRFRGHEVGSLLRRAAPCALVTDLAAGDDYGDILARVGDIDKASLRQILVRGPTEPTRTLAGIPAKLLRAVGTAADIARPDDPCAIFTTTGSTGEPKLVLHGQRGMVAQHFYSARRHEFDRPGAVMLANLPFCGIYGHTRLLMAVVGAAGIVLPDSTDIDGLIRRHRVTHVAGYSDVLARVVAAARGRPYDSMRLFSVAFSPLVDNDAVFAAAKALGLTLSTGYGSTELNAAIATPPDGWGAAAGGTLVHPDARFAIRDPESGCELPDGEPGALLIAGPGLFLGYYDDPTATANAWTADGMFRTGDRAYRRGNGFVLLGRYDESVRLGGYLVDPAEIEHFLRRRPEIAAARAIAADAGVGPRLVAFVKMCEGCAFSEADLLEACRDDIAAFKVPARIAAVDEFPVSEGANARKIRLDVLREMAATLLQEDA
jgi:fatty-acyl-CoA synthase